METINDRVKKVRQEANCKQSDFAALIGLKQASLSLVEKGSSNVTEQTIKLICYEFKINEEWLRYGTGEMYRTDFESIINRNDLDEIDREIIIAYATATKDQKDFIKTLIKNVAQKMDLLNCKKEEVKTDDELTREAKHQLLDEELDKAEKRQMLSASTTTNGLSNQEKMNNF